MKWNNKFIYPKSTRSIVNGSRHYSIDNSNLPSVTSILSATKSEEDKAGIEAWKARVGHKEAERIKGDTSENLIGLLERRLDAIVYRAKFVPTVFSARQFINHGHVKVNGRRVNIPSYRIKTTDIIEIKDKSRGLEIVLRGTESSERDIPEYIEVDSKKMTAKITKIPNLGEVPYPVTMEPNLVVEFYSRN